MLRLVSCYVNICVVHLPVITQRNAIHHAVTLALAKLALRHVQHSRGDG